MIEVVNLVDVFGIGLGVGIVIGAIATVYLSRLL
jgi:hypothetical protein